MAIAQMPNSLKRIFMVSLILIFIGTFAVCVFGLAGLKTNRKVQELEYFLAATDDLQLNFEKSLQMYTEETQAIIDYLVHIRPDTEEELLKVISDIEGIGHDLSLNVSLKSTNLIDNIAGINSEKTLDYNVAFYGDLNDTKSFLSAIEHIPYFIRIEGIEYKSPKNLSQEELERKPNVSIKIKLFIK